MEKVALWFLVAVMSPACKEQLNKAEEVCQAVAKTHPAVVACNSISNKQGLVIWFAEEPKVSLDDCWEAYVGRLESKAKKVKREKKEAKS